MKRYLFLACFLLAGTFSFSQTMFQRVYGGIHADISEWVKQTADGGYIVAGYTNSFGSGLNDYYLVKTNATGDTLWTHTYGTNADEQLTSACQTSDGGFLLCGTRILFNASTDIYLVKTDANGVLLWSTLYDDNGAVEYGHAVLEAANGDCIVAGTELVGFSPPAFCMLRFTASGSLLWSKKIAVTGSTGIYNVAMTAVQGGYVLAGENYTPGGLNICLLRTDTAGNVTWCNHYGSSNDEYRIK